MKKTSIIAFICFFNFAFAQNKTGSITQFGAKGDGLTDDYNSFTAAAASGLNIINLSAKTYFLNNSSGDRLARMLIAHDVLFQGTQGTVIKFTYNGLPLFTFTNSNQGGIKNVKFIYNGNTQTKADFTTLQFVQKLQLKVILSPYELASVIFGSNCNNLRFSNLVFDSETINDTTKGIGLCLNIKSKDALPASPTRGLNISNVIVNNCDIGMLIEGQEHFLITNIESERRFGSNFLPPGHVIYLVATGRNIFNKYGSIKNIYDYGNPINLGGRCLATLAPKCLDSCVIDNVISLHPEGLAQSIIKVNNCKFTNMMWIKNNNEASLAPFFNFTGPGSIYNNLFSKMLIFSKNTLPSITATSSVIDSMRNNTFSHIYVYTSLNYANYKRGIVGFLDINGHNNTFEKTDIETSDDPSQQKTNAAALWRTSSSYNKAEIIMKGKRANTWSNTVSRLGKSNSNIVNISSDDLGFNDLFEINKNKYSSLNFTNQGSRLISNISLPNNSGKQQVLFIKYTQDNNTITNSYLFFRELINTNAYRIIPLKIETPDNRLTMQFTEAASNVVITIPGNEFGHINSSGVSYSWIDINDVWLNLNK